MINVRVSDVMLSDDKSDYNIYVIGKGNKEGLITGIPKQLHKYYNQIPAHLSFQKF